jgi:hypothetical protein
LEAAIDVACDQVNALAAQLPTVPSTPEDMRAYALLAYFSADTDQAGRMTEIDDGDSFAMPAARLVQAHSRTML